MNQRIWLGAACAACAACGSSSSAADPDAAADGAAVTGLIINEVMASNTSACADPFGEFDDWVELYNPGASDIDLGGFTVTDDTTQPTKATLSAGVIVPAHGRKVLWCDDQVQGTDHLPFKLSADGEQFAIYAADGTLIDSVTFGAATTDVAFARLPDGTGEFASCAHATCGAANGATCAAVP